MKVYIRLWAKHDGQERRAEARQEAVERKLDEYWSWALQVQKDTSGRFSKAGAAYLVTENPLRVGWPLDVIRDRKRRPRQSGGLN